MSDVPDPKLCTCGHRFRWYEAESDPDTSSVFWEIEEELGLGHFVMQSDVVERPCPHRNGTVAEHCPKCDRQVGMWGIGAAGSMECDCWDVPASREGHYQ